MTAISSKKVFPCNTCDLTFEHSQDQRTHMREPWHIYNLKLRMVDLPSITADIYNETVATTLVSKRTRSSAEALSSQVVQSLPEYESADESDNYPIDERTNADCCLFCTTKSGSLEANISHMSLDHNLYLPQIERLSSLESIIGYLRNIIIEYKECLYCGVTKRSIPGIRRHMRDKEHCMINLEREPELLEFWELSDVDEHESSGEGEVPVIQADEDETPVPGDSSQGEYKLPSGKVVGSKSKAREARLHARRPVTSQQRVQNPTQEISENSVGDTDVAPSPETAGPLVDRQESVQNRVAATRDAAGLIGVPDQQMRNLVTLERKTQRQQAVVHASRSWAGDKGGIHQRHYKTKMNLRDG